MKRFLPVTLLLIVPLLAGCFSRRTIQGETFTLVAPPLANNAPTNRPVLAVQRISVAQPFDTSALMYRTGEFAFERDPYAGFLDSSAASFGEPIRARLQNAGLFHIVIGPDSTLQPDLQLETSIKQLYGDFRDRAQPSAVLELRFLLIEDSGRSGKNVIFQKAYLRRIPLKGRTASAVVASLNEALQEIMKEFTADLKTLRNS